MLFLFSILLTSASLWALYFICHKVQTTTTFVFILLLIASIVCFATAVLGMLGCVNIANRCNNPQKKYVEVMAAKTYVEQNELTIYNFNKYKAAIEKVEKYKIDYRSNKRMRNSIWTKVYANKHWDTAKYIDYEINPEYLKCVKN